MPSLTFELQQLINLIPSESLNEWALLYSSVLQENKTSMKSVLFIFVCKIVVSLFVLLCGFGCHWWSIVCPSVTSPCNVQLCNFVQLCNHTIVQLCKCAIIQLCSCAILQLCNCVNVQMCNHTVVQMCNRTIVLLHIVILIGSSQVPRLLLLLSNQLGILTIDYHIAAQC